MCGAIRPKDQAFCAELEGHDDDGRPHLWVGGAKNLCIAEPVRVTRPEPEPRKGAR
jgi:hypothetical protein